MRVAKTWAPVLMLTALCTAFAAVPAAHASIGLSPFLTSVNKPMYVTAPPGDSHRLFIVERPGVIQVAVDGVLQSTPFLDISANVWTTGEAGLASMAFDPNYASNGLFYVYFVHKPTGTQTNGPIDIEEFHADPNTSPDVADPTSGRLVLEIPHNDASNHYGGTLAFGKDGLLYIGTGDGGGGNNQYGNAQDTKKSLLGKLLRIDPHAVTGPPSAPYSIPDGNPFKGQSLCTAAAVPSSTDCPEILAWGLRNPFRWSFDRDTGDLLIGDVGQSAYEEIDYVPSTATLAGDNFGWPCREGPLVGPGDPSGPNPDPACPLAARVDPVFGYSHMGLTGSVAITGGVVIRDPSLGAWDGRYLYSDFYAGQIHSLVPGTPAASDDRVEALPTVNQLVSFGQDADGHVYVVQLSTSSNFSTPGTVQRLVCVDTCSASTPPPGGGGGGGGTNPNPPPPSPASGSNGGSSAPPLAQPSHDTTPPRLRVHAARRQNALRRGFVRISVSCDQDCIVRTTGTARGVRLRGVLERLRANTPTLFELKLSQRLRRALARRGAITILIRARDLAGNLATARLTVALSRPR